MAIEGDDHEVDQLFSAVERDDVDEVSRLLEDGPHLMEVKRGGWLRRQTPLQIAAAWRRVGVLRLLVEKGADVNICDTDGDTQLHFAAKMGHEDVVSILLRGGVDIGKKGKDGSTALAIASEAGHTGVVWQLLQHMAGNGLDEVTAQVNTCYTDGRTALHCAAGKGHEEVVSALLSCGAESSKRTSSNGNTALMLASYGGHIGVVRQLLQHTGGRGLNETNGWGATALWWACSYGRVEVVRALLWAGADRTIARDGVTPRQVAQNNRHAECVALLDWWEETELERGYVIHRARCLLELSSMLAPLDKTASIPAYLLIPKYLVACIRRPPIVHLVSLAEGPEGAVEKSKREGEEGGEEEKDATLKYVTHDLARELFVELMEGFYK